MPGLLPRATKVALLIGGVGPLAVCAALLGAASLPSLMGYRSYIVLTGSMEPAIPVGAVVVGQVVRTEEVRVGDVITFFTDQQPGVNVTHRVVAIDGDGPERAIHTRGDANGTADVGTVDVHQSVARMIYAVPWAGYLVEALRTTRVRLMLVGAGLLFLWLRSIIG